jgi:putative membrane protein
MKQHIIATACCIFLSGPALAESLGEKTGVNSLVGVSPTTQDFVSEAAISDMFEIQSSKLAEDKQVDAQTKAFAEHMVNDHSKTTSELKTFVAKLNITVPHKLDSAHQSMLDKLKGLDGADFAKLYHDDQDSGHKNAVSLFKRYADGGDNPDLKAWAAKVLPTIEQHLKSAEALDHNDRAKADKTPVVND